MSAIRWAEGTPLSARVYEWKPPLASLGEGGEGVVVVVVGVVVSSW